MIKENDVVCLKREPNFIGYAIKVNKNSITVKWKDLEWDTVENIKVLKKINKERKR